MLSCFLISVAGYISLAEQERSVVEGDTVDVCWTLTPSNLTLERAVNVAVSTEPSTASSSDYEGFTQSVVPLTAAGVCHGVAIEGDNVIEEMEIFMLELSNTDQALHIEDGSMSIQVGLQISKILQKIPR